MNKLPFVPYRVIDNGSEVPLNAPVQLEAQRIDAHGRPSYRQHPQMRSLAGFGRPLQPEEIMPHPDTVPPGYLQHPGHYGHPGQYPQAQGATNVSVNNNGNFYRPVKEELTLSLVKTIGNFFAWPFRLIGRFIESLVQAGASVLKGILLMIIAPMLLFTGYEFYQSHKGQPAGAMAAELGKDGVHLVGAMLGGIWDGIFGDDEPETQNTAAAKPSGK